MDELKLKPCPFCDGAAKLETEMLFGRSRHSAVCQTCGARGSRCETAEEAVERWNARPETQDNLDAMCSQIKKVVRTESDDGDWYAALLQDGSWIHFHEMNDILRRFIFDSTHAVCSYADYTGQTVYERR